MTPDQQPLGVNLVGYHHVTSGLGTAVREIDRCLTAGGIDVHRVDVTTTNSPIQRTPEDIPSHLHPTTIAVVTASELPRVWNDFEPVRAATRHHVGVLFWELSTIPDAHRAGIDIVDEIWAPTSFIHQAYARCGRSVVHMPVRLSEPTCSTEAVARWRQDLRLRPEEFVFLSSFDLFSIIHRKNPLGSIDAFVAAFGRDQERPVRLVLKVLNGEVLQDDLELIQHAAAADPRITIVERHLSDVDHHALIAVADCFVSLHRSEGLGLQLAASMWLGTTVLATRYGGNLDFMDDTCAALIDTRPTRVGDGRGAYPDDAHWAEPSLEHAVTWMRTLVERADLRAELATHARRRMIAQPSEREFGTMYRDALAKSAPGSVNGM